MRKYYTDEQLAAIVHSAQCRLQYEQGDPAPSQPWEAETEHIRESCIEGVRRARAGVTPEQHHEAWLKYKQEAGWVYGAEKDPARKTHPGMITYRDLPESYKDKNRLFLMIVAALTIELWEMLYKVTKIQYRRTWDNETRSYSGEYKVYRKRTDYRTNKGAVTLAYKYAEDANFSAERTNAYRPGSDPYKYEVQVEIADSPDFQPAVRCDKHGWQPAFNVPGLTSELTCVDCI